MTWPTTSLFESNIMRIFLDVETVPSQAPGARDLVRRSIKPPATMTVPSTIEKWWAERSADAIEEAYRKQSLDGGLHGELRAVRSSVSSAEEA